MRIKVKVKPSSGRQEIIKDEFEENSFTVFLKSAPENGKANAELVKVLQKYFNRPVRIKSGMKMRKKIVEVEE